MLPPDYRYILFFSILLISFLGPVRGQQKASGMEVPDTDIPEMIQSRYDSLFQTHNIRINGSLHQGRYDPGEGHPFFGEKSWRSGTLGAGLQVVNNQVLRYDLLNDCLLLQHFSLSGSHAINLNKQVVYSFTLDGHSFYFLDSSNFDRGISEAGYYELAYGAETEVWVKWEKYFAERSQEGGEYVNRNSNYIERGGTFYRISNKKSLLRVFPGREDELKAYMRKERMVIRNGNVDQIVDLVKYIENRQIE
jgi:hypothetical protein